jgi:hypothetical protein
MNTKEGQLINDSLHNLIKYLLMLTFSRNYIKTIFIEHIIQFKCHHGGAKLHPKVLIVGFVF